MKKELPSVCVIGAGPSGLIAMRELKERGVPFEAFEKSDRVGGLWVYQNKNGMSATYNSLHINTSKETMEFACYPMPKEYPDYCHHSLVATYFENFAKEFELHPHIHFETSVEEAQRLDDGLWRVTLSNGEIRLYDALVVANGHHWDPRWPEPGFPGEFKGIQMHSHDYKDPTTPHNLRGKRVVIVGMGNSAMDIACELGATYNAKEVTLAIRRGTHILPKYFGGKPVDKIVRHPSQTPWLIERLTKPGMLSRLLYPLLGLRTRLAVGRPEDFGLPKPKHRFGETHPTISNEIHTRLGSGDVKAKGNIKELKGDRVVFEDGEELECDAIIYATGYKISFPFFKSQVMDVDATDNDIALYKRVMDPRYANLFFIGLVQPLCSITPIAEVQSRWVSEYLTGHYMLPSEAQMNEEMRRSHEEMKKRYVRSPRHTIQIECMEYTHDLYNESQKGRERAQEQGYPLPVTAKAKQLIQKEAPHGEKSARRQKRANKGSQSGSHSQRSQEGVPEARV